MIKGFYQNTKPSHQLLLIYEKFYSLTPFPFQRMFIHNHLVRNKGPNQSYLGLLVLLFVPKNLLFTFITGVFPIN
jgi:hypothetical protein